MKNVNRLKIILLILSFFVVYLLGMFTNRNNLIRGYWRYRTSMSNFTVNHPALSKFLFPNFDSIYPDEYLSINEKPLLENESPLSFYVIGHVYGDHNEDAFHPPIDLITNVQKINDANPDLVIMLGDMVTKPTNKEFMDLENYLLKPFRMPIFNAVGNHDVLDRNAYENRYGKTVYSFLYKDYLFVVLDTNIKFCSILPDQYEFIGAEIERAQGEVPLKGVMLLMHHVLFLDQSKDWKDDIFSANDDCVRTTGFTEFVTEELTKISDELPIHIFAGDVGSTDSQLSPYYEAISGKNIYMYATGLGNSDMDSILYVNEVDGQLQVEVFALDGREMLPIENYDHFYWEK